MLKKKKLCVPWSIVSEFRHRMVAIAIWKLGRHGRGENSAFPLRSWDGEEEADKKIVWSKVGEDR
jgi:hypothetical protein